jgi:hypothetical protein
MTRNQKTLIAILIPLAVVSGVFAAQKIVQRIEHNRAMEQYRRERLQVEANRLQAQISTLTGGTQEQTPPAKPEKEEVPKFYLPKDINQLRDPEKVEKLALEMLDWLLRPDAAEDQRYRAYHSLINCQQDATAVLYDALASDNPLKVYYALTACADLKSLYFIDMPDGRSFEEAALKITDAAPPDVKTKLARLLGLYRDKDAVKRLNALAADENPNVKYAALLSLAHVGDASSVPSIAAALQSNNPAILAAACRAMEAILTYEVGTQFVFLPDYGPSLNKQVEKWQQWWERNKASYPPQ